MLNLSKNYNIFTVEIALFFCLMMLILTANRPNFWTILLNPLENGYKDFPIWAWYAKPFFSSTDCFQPLYYVKSCSFRGSFATVKLTVMERAFI